MIRKAQNEDVEVRLDLTDPESNICYRYRDNTDMGWVASPFARRHVKSEAEALMLIDSWLHDGGRR